MVQKIKKKDELFKKINKKNSLYKRINIAITKHLKALY